MSKGHSLQDPYLNALRKERVPVSIYLVNGIKLQGQIESFDQIDIHFLYQPKSLKIVKPIHSSTHRSKWKVLQMY